MNQSFVIKINFALFMILIGSFIHSYIPYDEFKLKFQLADTSTEKLHPLTMNLSQTMHKNIINGLNVLLAVDEIVIQGFDQKINEIYNILIPAFKESLKNKGRIFFIGSGSSGRLAIDLAAKTKKNYKYRDQIEGIIAGGDAAMVRAKEGFEDSEEDGKFAVSKFNLSKNDTIVLISGSGSASFNVGCGNFAADIGCKVYYFYNSIEVPSRTSNLFLRKSNPVIPILIDIGPQAIAGSTRLQAATLAIICLGSCLELALSDDFNIEKQNSYKNYLSKSMYNVINKIKSQASVLQKIIEEEVRVFSDPRANFRRLRDYSDQGYVTMLAPMNSIREAFIDTLHQQNHPK